MDGTKGGGGGGGGWEAFNGWDEGPGGPLYEWDSKGPVGRSMNGTKGPVAGPLYQ